MNTLQTSLRFMTEFMLKTIHTELRNIHSYSSLDAIVLELDAMENASSLRRVFLYSVRSLAHILELYSCNSFHPFQDDQQQSWTQTNIF